MNAAFVEACLGRFRLNRLGLGVLALITIIGSVGCSSGLPEPTAADVTIAAKHWPSRTLAELERGKELYVERCASCHMLHRPEELAPERWSAVVTEMNAQPGVNLSEREKELVIAYLFSASVRLKRASSS